MAKKLAGLYRRSDGIWQIRKFIRQYGSISCSTGTRSYAEAETIALRLFEEARQASTLGERPKRTFRDAATKYLTDYMGKRSISRDAQALKLVDRYIGHLPLEQVHATTLERFIADRKRAGIAQATINRDLAVVRRILNLAARLWRHPGGQAWLATAPLLQLMPDMDARKPYPLSWDESRLLLQHLPRHLANMALFALHTGCRDGEICALQWDWEVRVPELGVTVFILPAEVCKGKRERVVVLNRVARSVVDSVRGEHRRFVFVYDNHPIGHMRNSAWKRARLAASDQYTAAIGGPPPWGFRHLRVHDLRHTLGRRMRAAGMPLEDREDVLGHFSGRMTTHYSAAELSRLLDGLERVSVQGDCKDSANITLLRLVGAGREA